MASITKLDQAMKIKRLEGKAALEQCLFAKERLKFTSTRFVQQNPWPAVGLSALVAFVLARSGQLSRVTSSVSSLALLLNSVTTLDGQVSHFLSSQVSPSASADNGSLKSDKAK